MVSMDTENLVSDIRLSSVVPARVTGEDKVHSLTNMDLAMKLHYLKGVYFFQNDAVQGLSIYDLKKPLFQLLDLYYPAAGRIRRSENGRPVIKCNDSGVRIVEAQCSKSVDEMVGMNDSSLHYRYLTYNHILGPDLGFSPLVFIQFTRFKCGGLSVGLSWAHILGDAFSASNFMNLVAQITSGPMPPQSLKFPNAGNHHFPSPIPRKPFSLKSVDPVGDHWLTTNNCKMETHSLHVTPKQLNHLLSTICTSHPFEALAAIMWKSLAKIRGGQSEPKIVTICTNSSRERKNEISSNSQIVSTVEADFVVAKADVSELAKMIAEKKVDERSTIEELVERENGKSDFIVYGANLTFVNLEGANIYGLEFKGKKAIFANYTISGAGDDGVILVLPGPKNGKIEDGDGKIVTMVLPQYQLVELKNELEKEWGIF